MLANKNRVNTDSIAGGSILPSIKDIFNIGITFFLTLIAWVFFRSENVTEALEYVSIIFSTSLFQSASVLPVDFLLIIASFIAIEWINRSKLYPLEPKQTTKLGYREPIFVIVIVWAIILWGAFDNKEFIYFQF